MKFALFIFSILFSLNVFSQNIKIKQNSLEVDESKCEKTKFYFAIDISGSAYMFDGGRNIFEPAKDLVMSIFRDGVNTRDTFIELFTFNDQLWSFHNQIGKDGRDSLYNKIQSLYGYSADSSTELLSALNRLSSGDYAIKTKDESNKKFQHILIVFTDDSSYFPPNSKDGETYTDNLREKFNKAIMDLNDAGIWVIFERKSYHQTYVKPNLTRLLYDSINNLISPIAVDTLTLIRLITSCMA